jgi:hypothetical protein
LTTVPARLCSVAIRYASKYLAIDRLAALLDQGPFEVKVDAAIREPPFVRQVADVFGGECDRSIVPVHGPESGSPRGVAGIDSRIAA